MSCMNFFFFLHSMPPVLASSVTSNRKNIQTSKIEILYENEFEAEIKRIL